MALEHSFWGRRLEGGSQAGAGLWYVGVSLHNLMLPLVAGGSSFVLGFSHLPSKSLGLSAQCASISSVMPLGVSSVPPVPPSVCLTHS